jgi:hypothetical protein
MGNYVIAVGNYMIADPSNLGNFMIADSQQMHLGSVIGAGAAGGLAVDRNRPHPAGL